MTLKDDLRFRSAERRGSTKATSWISTGIKDLPNTFRSHQLQNYLAGDLLHFPDNPCPLLVARSRATRGH